MRSATIVALVLSLLMQLTSSARAQAPSPALGAAGYPGASEPPPPIVLVRPSSAPRRARLLLTVGSGVLVGSSLFLLWSRKPLCDPQDDPGPERADWITGGAGAALGLGLTFGGAFMFARQTREARGSLSPQDVVLLVLLGAAVAGTAAATARGARLTSAAFCPS